MSNSNHQDNTWLVTPAAIDIDTQGISHASIESDLIEIDKLEILTC